MEAYQALGCQIANIDLEEFRHTPEGLRMVTCSQERFVPSKAKWWLVIYAAGRESFVAGPYDHIGQCADSNEAHAKLQQNPPANSARFHLSSASLANPHRDEPARGTLKSRH